MLTNYRHIFAVFLAESCLEELKLISVKAAGSMHGYYQYPVHPGQVVIQNYVMSNVPHNMGMRGIHNPFLPGTIHQARVKVLKSYGAMVSIEASNGTVVGLLHKSKMLPPPTGSNNANNNGKCRDKRKCKGKKKAQCQNESCDPFKSLKKGQFVLVRILSVDTDGKYAFQQVPFVPTPPTTPTPIQQNPLHFVHGLPGLSDDTHSSSAGLSLVGTPASTPPYLLRRLHQQPHTPRGQMAPSIPPHLPKPTPLPPPANFLVPPDPRFNLNHSMNSGSSGRTSIVSSRSGTPTTDQDFGSQTSSRIGLKSHLSYESLVSLDSGRSRTPEPSHRHALKISYPSSTTPSQTSANNYPDSPSSSSEARTSAFANITGSRRSKVTLRKPRTPQLYPFTFKNVQKTQRHINNHYIRACKAKNRTAISIHKRVVSAFVAIPAVELHHLDAYTFSQALTSAVRLLYIELAELIFTLIPSNILTAYHYSSLIKGFCMVGQFDRASLLFKEVCSSEGHNLQALTKIFQTLVDSLIHMRTESFSCMAMQELETWLEHCSRSKDIASDSVAHPSSSDPCASSSLSSSISPFSALPISPTLGLAMSFCEYPTRVSEVNQLLTAIVQISKFKANQSSSTPVPLPSLVSCMARYIENVIRIEATNGNMTGTESMNDVDSDDFEGNKSQGKEGSDILPSVDAEALISLFQVHQASFVPLESKSTDGNINRLNFPNVLQTLLECLEKRDLSLLATIRASFNSKIVSRNTEHREYKYEKESDSLVDSETTSGLPSSNPNTTSPDLSAAE